MNLNQNSIIKNGIYLQVAALFDDIRLCTVYPRSFDLFYIVTVVVTANWLFITLGASEITANMYCNCTVLGRLRDLQQIYLR